MFLGTGPFWWDIGHSCTWISYALAFLKQFSQRICVPKQHKEYMVTEIEHWQYHQQYNIGKFYMCLWTLDYDDWCINSQQWKTLRECGVNTVIYIPLGTVLKELCCSLTCEFESSSTDSPPPPPPLFFLLHKKKLQKKNTTWCVELSFFTYTLPK